MGEETVSDGTGARGDHATGTNLNEFVSFLTLLIGCFCSGTNTRAVLILNLRQIVPY